MLRPLLLLALAAVWMVAPDTWGPLGLVLGAVVVDAVRAAYVLTRPLGRVRGPSEWEA